MLNTYQTSSQPNQFTINIKSQPNHGLQIIQIESTHYALDNNGIAAQNYCYEISCYNPQYIALSTLIAQPATLIFYDKCGKPFYQHGVITLTHDAKQLHHAARLRLQSPLYALTCNIQHRVYHQVTLPQLISQILNQYASSSLNYQLLLNNDYPLREYVVQYQESDYAFLHRQCAYFGVFFTFIQTAEQAILILCDDIQQLSQQIGNDTFHYQQPNGQVSGTSASIFQMNWRWSMMTDTICINDYNYREPDVSLLLESRTESNSIALTRGINTNFNNYPLTTDFVNYSPSCEYRFQDHYHTLTEGKLLLKIRQESLNCQRKIWQIKSDAVYLQPGYLIHIEHHPLSSMNGFFYVISVQHFVDQTAAFPFIQMSPLKSHLCYFNIALLIPAQLPFRPRAPEPLYQDNCIAKITGTPGNYAPIDEHGRYLIRPLFDTTNTADDSNSHPVRLVHPLNGSHYGMHFPLPYATEVLLTHINGDPNRPIIMGALPNLNSLPPVTAVNKSQHILKSRGDNQFVFEDQQHAEYIELQTADQKNRVLLDASQEQEQIVVAAKQGTVHLQAALSICSQSHQNHKHFIGNEHHIFVNNHQQIVSQQGDISFTAATDLMLSAYNDITLVTQYQDFVMQAGTDTNIHAEKNANLIIRQGDLVIQVWNGKIQLEANHGIILKSTGDTQQIKIAQNGASIQMTEQEIKIASPVAIHFLAKQINLQGKVVFLNYSATSSSPSTNLILHFQDELSGVYTTLNGIYHLLA